MAPTSRSDLVAPRPPFDGVAAHYSSPKHGFYAWFIVDPDGWICRYSPGLVLTGELAEHVVTDGWTALQAHFPSTERFFFVQDFVDMVSYESSARVTFTDWGKRIAKRTSRTVVIPPPMNPMIRVGLQAATAALRLTGSHLETSPSVQQAIKKYALHPDRRS